jgi:tetratricopeptide (TPR) repeat protein
MDEQYGLSTGWIIAIYGIAAALSAFAALRGVQIESEPYMLTGLAGLIVTLTTFPICLRCGSSSGETHNESLIGIDRLKSQISKMTKSIEHLEETMILSDDARRVLNRHKERELLSKAIDEDIERGDFHAAIVLVNELAQRFGYREEAEEFRAKIDHVRTKTERNQIQEEIANLDELIRDHHWDQALQDAARISRVYHDSPLADGLRHRVEFAKQRYKDDIERRFLMAAQDDRIEEAMEMIQEMDHLLTEAESERFKEVARGVIGRAKENLGAEFKLAIHDKAWDTAAIVGQRIIEEFPNSRMAGEVRDLIDTVRDRASTVARD